MATLLDRNKIELDGWQMRNFPSRKKDVSSRGGSAVMNPTSNHENVGLIPGLTQWVKDRHCCELYCSLHDSYLIGQANSIKLRKEFKSFTTHTISWARGNPVISAQNPKNTFMNCLQQRLS